MFAKKKTDIYYVGTIHSSMLTVDNWTYILNILGFMDAVARDDLGKDVIDKEVVEKVSQEFLWNQLWLSPNELLYDLIYCFNNCQLTMHGTMIRIPEFLVIHPLGTISI